MLPLLVLLAEDPPPPPPPVEEPPVEEPPVEERTAPEAPAPPPPENATEGDPETQGAPEGTVVGGPLPAPAEGPDTVHWSQVKVKRQVQPKYPAAARQQGIEGSCQVRFFIDQNGKPIEVELLSCPEVFHESTREAAMGWRFYPYEDAEGQRQEATFVLTIRYKLR